MTLLSLTDCCHLLAIDAKTLRRWLAQAQLTVQPHPGDARSSAITADHLRLLATAHHRRLPPLPEACPALASAAETQAPSPLPPEVLTLLQRLSTLPAQLAAVQQHVADLTHLLQQHAHEPTISAAPPQQAKSAKHPSKHAFPAPRSRPAAAAKPPPKSAHVLPRVEYGGEGRYVVLCPQGGMLPLEPNTPAWFAWLATQSSFRFVGRAGHFTAHHAWRVPRGAWRAHRHIRNHGYSLRLAPTPELTIAVLEQAAEALQAHLK